MAIVSASRKSRFPEIDFNCSGKGHNADLHASKGLEWMNNHRTVSVSGEEISPTNREDLWQNGMNPRAR